MSLSSKDCRAALDIKFITKCWGKYVTDLTENELFDDDKEAQVIELHKQPVDLYKILKFEGLVGSGGEAKTVIDKGLVILNSVVEKQKRKKVFSGDVLKFNGMCYQVLCKVSLDSTELENIASENRSSLSIISSFEKATELGLPLFERKSSEDYGKIRRRQNEFHDFEKT